MTLKKDKKKVLGEVFSDERIKTFLDFTAPEGVDRDFHLLEKAYRGMNAENFATFINYYQQADHNLNATNPDNKTLLQLISPHRMAQEYIRILKTAGAK